MRIFILFFVGFFFGFFAPRAVFAESLGEKADIVEASFDKSSYQKGDAITADVRWEAHGFKAISRNGGEGERLVADLSVFTLDGTACGPSVSKSVFSEDTEFPIATVAAIDCQNPQARVTFIGADSKLLDVAVITAVPDVSETASPEGSVSDGGQGIVMKDGAAYAAAEMQNVSGSKKPFLASGIIIAGAVSTVALIVLIIVLVWRARKRRIRNF